MPNRSRLYFATADARAANKIGEFKASGFIFKDSVEAVSVEDPDGMLCPALTQCVEAFDLDVLVHYAVQGVTLYISDFHRSLPDKLNKDFFNEPSQVCMVMEQLEMTNRAVDCLTLWHAGFCYLCLDRPLANCRLQSYFWP